MAGSPEEEKQLKAAREGKSATVAPTANSESNRGQLIFFFVDDAILPARAGRGRARFCSTFWSTR
jgi:hypothetical protein